MLSILLNNAGKFLEVAKTWRMRQLLMLPGKDNFHIFLAAITYRYLFDSRRLAIHQFVWYKLCTFANIVFVYRCRTDSSHITSQYNTLHQAHELFNHTSDKLSDVISGHDSRASTKVGTYTTCSVFYSYISSLISSGTSVISSHSTSSTVVSISSSRGDSRDYQ